MGFIVVLSLKSEIAMLWASFH